MTWERFFLLAIISTPIMATSWLLWVILPSGVAYVLGHVVCAVVVWHGKRMYDDAVKDIAIRNGSWLI